MWNTLDSGGPRALYRSMVMLILVIAIAGFAVWLIEKNVPMAPPFPTLLRAVVALLCLVLVLRYLGVWDAALRY